MEGTAARTDDYSSCIRLLLSDPLANQELLGALVSNIPAVPREVYTDDENAVSALLILHRFTYRDGSRAAWVDMEGSTEEGVRRVLLALPEGEIGFSIHRPWMIPLVEELFEIEFDGLRYDYTVDRETFHPFTGYHVTALGEEHLEMMRSYPPIHPSPPVPALSEQLEWQLRGDPIRIFILFEEGEIAAYATAEGICDEVWGVHPYTLEAYRGKGYGRAVMSAATEAVLSMGRLPYYDAGPGNPAAVRIAEALGFRVYQEVRSGTGVRRSD